MCVWRGCRVLQGVAGCCSWCSIFPRGRGIITFSLDVGRFPRIVGGRHEGSARGCWVAFKVSYPLQDVPKRPSSARARASPLARRRHGLIPGRTGQAERRSTPRLGNKAAASTPSTLIGAACLPSVDVNGRMPGAHGRKEDTAKRPDACGARRQVRSNILRGPPNSLCLRRRVALEIAGASSSLGTAALRVHCDVAL